jgi:heterotetrameric sarcosine oxidase delta subunit
MLKLTCPFCGARNESEFIHGGACKPRRSEAPQELDDAAWIEYLTVPPNPIGPLDERWWHLRGCGKWFTVRRNTLTHQILQPGDEQT